MSLIRAAVFFVALCAAGLSARAEDVTVFAAASLTNALQEAGAAYKAATGKTIKFSFASSSVLAKQIEAGAPADIFISADEPWMNYLSEKGLIEEGSRISPIGNTLVLIAPSSDARPPILLNDKTDLGSLLGAQGRLAVGEPAHVPAGVYAKQALQSLGQWGALEPRLARAENVRAALALVETGEAPLGVVYATDAAASTRVATIAAFPRSAHAPITYPFALVRGHNADAASALAFLTGPDALRIFVRLGFSSIAGS
ncbi:MAG: molybdate ABC transporter substrate-binding protein [Hyphomicrobiales bacterium]|nr:molybdate ABC transporter substrate-binding protein [Hyphomicrobiales bacterium]